MFVYQSSAAKAAKEAADDRDQLDLDSIIGRLLEVSTFSRLRSFFEYAFGALKVSIC